MKLIRIGNILIVRIIIDILVIIGFQKFGIMLI